MIALKKLSISGKLKFKYRRLTSWKPYLVVSTSIFLVNLIIRWGDIYTTQFSRGWGYFKNYSYAKSNGFNGNYDDFIYDIYTNAIIESTLFTAIEIGITIVAIYSLRLLPLIVDEVSSIVFNNKR